MKERNLWTALGLFGAACLALGLSGAAEGGAEALLAFPFAQIGQRFFNFRYASAICGFVGTIEIVDAEIAAEVDDVNEVIRRMHFFARQQLHVQLQSVVGRDAFQGRLVFAVIGDGEDYCWPCGVCRQVMAEFCGDDFRVIAAKDETDFASSTLGELLPHAFRFGKK